MGFINGDIELLYFKIDGIYTPIGCLTSNSFNEEVDMLKRYEVGVPMSISNDK